MIWQYLFCSVFCFQKGGILKKFDHTTKRNPSQKLRLVRLLCLSICFCGVSWVIIFSIFGFPFVACFGIPVAIPFGGFSLFLRLRIWDEVVDSLMKHAGLCPNCEYYTKTTPRRCPECGLEYPLHFRYHPSTKPPLYWGGFLLLVFDLPHQKLYSIFG